MGLARNREVLTFKMVVLGQTVGTGVNIDLMIVGVMKTTTIKMATKNLNMSKRGTYVNTYLTFGVQGLCHMEMG